MSRGYGGRGRGAAPGLFDQFSNPLPVGLLTLARLFSFLGQGHTRPAGLWSKDRFRFRKEIALPK
jgi:hypothetical protein